MPFPGQLPNTFLPKHRLSISVQSRSFSQVPVLPWLSSHPSTHCPSQPSHAYPCPLLALFPLLPSPLPHPCSFISCLGPVQALPLLQLSTPHAHPSPLLPPPRPTHFYPDTPAPTSPCPAPPRPCLVALLPRPHLVPRPCHAPLPETHGPHRQASHPAVIAAPGVPTPACPSASW